MRTPALAFLLVALLLGIAGCGDAAAPIGDGGGAAAAEIEILGHVDSPGTRGSILVFAFSGTPTVAELGGIESASVAALASDGRFALSVPPSDALTIAFLADGSNDGVIDGGDPVVILTDPRLSKLQVGDGVRISEIALDFGAGQARGTVDVQRAGAVHEAVATPTAVPAG
jgi:hypothetical protein